MEKLQTQKPTQICFNKSKTDPTLKKKYIEQNKKNQINTESLEQSKKERFYLFYKKGRREIEAEILQ